jgi:hypothetical protein
MRAVASNFAFEADAVRLTGRGWHALERNSPEERGAHRDFARKESGN